jgi:CHAD domain-containing protein
MPRIVRGFAIALDKTSDQILTFSQACEKLNPPIDIKSPAMPVDLNRIQKSVRKVKKFVKNAPAQPSPKQIHDLRTHARKLESAFHALSLDSSSDERRLLKSIKRVRQRAGKVRDMDVLMGHVCSANADGEPNCEIQLLEHLGAQRRKHAKKLHSTVVKESAVLKKGLKQEAAELVNVLQDGSPSEAATDAMAHAVELTTKLADPPRLNRSNLHPYRLKVKELRYVLQMAQTDGQPTFVKDLGEVKDAIGEWHDWEELIAMAGDVLDHSSGCQLLRKFKEIGGSKYEQALALATKLRKNYLKPGRKKPNRSGAGGQLKPPVLVATSALISGTRKQAA